MHEVKVAICYTLLVNRSELAIVCMRGQATCLKWEADLELNEVLLVTTRIRDEALDFRVLRPADPFDRDHALSVEYNDFEDMQIIYIREDEVGKLFLDGIPRDHGLFSVARFLTPAFKADMIREKHLLSNKKKIYNHTNATVILSDKVDLPGHLGAYTTLVSIKPDKVGTLRYYDNRARLDFTRYRLDVQGSNPIIFREWTGTEFLEEKVYISIFDAGTTPKTIDIQSWPRTYKRIMNKASSLFRNS